MPLTVWTIGHSTRSFDAFASLLKQHGIEALLDVRTVPRSRHVPWASIGELPGLLAREGIVYEHVPELGGLRHAKRDSINDAWRNDSFRGYADHMQSDEFAAGLAHLLRSAQRHRTAIMCAEAVPWRCHRSLVTDALLARGVGVLHVMGEGPAKEATMTPFARVGPDGTSVTYPAASGRQTTLG